jgi:hypothetical protein
MQMIQRRRDAELYKGAWAREGDYALYRTSGRIRTLHSHPLEECSVEEIILTKAKM